MNGKSVDLYAKRPWHGLNRPKGIFLFIFQQNPYRLGREEQTCRGGHEGQASGRASSTARVDVIRVVGMARDGRFRGIDNGQMENSSRLQFPSHHARKRTHRRACKVGDDQLFGVHFIARAHGAKHGNAELIRADGKLHLRGNRVDGVDDNVILGKVDFVRIFGQIKHGERRHLRFGIDIRDTLLHDLGFIFADGGMERDELTVDIGHGHVVGINERDRADADSRKRLRAERADTADTEKDHPFRL